MTHQQQIAERLAQLRREKSARERRDIRQDELAKVIRATSETYSRYENGKRSVPDEAIIALAKFYGVSPAFIRYGVQILPADQGAAEAVKTYSPEEIAEFQRIVAEDATRRAAASRKTPAKRRRSNGR